MSSTPGLDWDVTPTPRVNDVAALLEGCRGELAYACETRDQLGIHRASLAVRVLEERLRHTRA